jgi:hypothetical protein
MLLYKIIFFIFLLLFILYQLNNIIFERIRNDSIINKKTNNIDTIDNDKNLGFIVLRHVNSTKTNLLWVNCIKCIRKYYNNKIVIIDDNSNDYLDNLDAPLDNVEIINSEFPKRGEILPYYYLYTKRLFDRSVIIHDSIFFNKKLDFNYDKCKFLFDFTSDEWDIDKDKIRFLIKFLNNSYDLTNIYSKKEWHGCFGVMSYITLDFITHIQNKYNFFNLLEYVNSRPDRMCLERIFALLACVENPILLKEPSMFGKIHDYMKWEYSYDEYLKDKYTLKAPIIKVWSGR